MSHQAQTNATIAITQGDCAGIGPEIIAKAFRDAPQEMRGCFVVGELQTLRRATALVAGLADGGQAVAQPIALISQAAEAWDVPCGAIPLLALPDLPGPQAYGQISAQAGDAAARCVVWAAQAA
ncbi:MAG: 4-hydroxythreonine-4-phosphate dehydrogenase PdxA, partial [Comamonas sp.]